MREKVLIKLANWHVSHPWRMLLIVLLLTVFFVAFAIQLQVTMRWSDLLPSNDQRTIQFNKIIDEFVSATSLVVVVQGEEDRIKAFADVLAPKILALRDPDNNGKKLFRRVDYKAETGFLKNHGLMLIKEDDLENLKDVFTDPNLDRLLFNLNNAMEKEYVGKEESLSTREKEDGAVYFLDGIQELVLALKDAAAGSDLSDDAVQKVADKLLIGEPYFLSYDEKALILNVIPNFTMMDTHYMVVGTDAAQDVVDGLLEEFPDVQSGLTGFIAIGRDEMVYSEKSLGYTTLIAVIAILILLVVSFRMWVAPVLAMASLLVGLVWAVGAASIVVGQLNIMTQMMAVILLGLGIDFSIHIISGFTERRAAGDDIAQSMVATFLKSGKGIITGAFTTACAFLTLVISHSRGMKEMGLVTGTGLLAILFATFFFLPTLLVLRERRLDRKRKSGKAKKAFIQRDISFRFLGNLTMWLGKHYVFTIATSIAITVLLVWSATKITFDHNYMNIEPKGLTSITLQDTVLEKFDLGMDYALVLTDDVDQSRSFAKEYRELGSVAVTEDISVYLPSDVEQNRRIPHILEIQEKVKNAEIKETIGRNDMAIIKEEVGRLEMNVMEMQDMAFIGGQDKVDNKCKEIVGEPGKPESKNIFQELLIAMETDEIQISTGFSDFHRKFAPYFKQAVIRMGSTESIGLEDLPESILDRYGNAARDQFLVTVFPAGNIWQDKNFLDRFVSDLEGVSDRATGMPPVFRALVEIIGRDGRNAVLLTILLVFFILSVDFRSPRMALMAMIPLACGIFWMVGLMHIVGMQLTVMNVMGLPLIVGIGIDDGVHIVHRWKHEGKGKIGVVFASTGKAILLTSLTTMLAFGSLVFSIWRGFGHLGGALFLGVGACFLTTVLGLSGLIGMTERK
jgi:predicted RND superfamily exporter protein